MPTSPHQCPNCPAGYNCETGDYSFDDFEEIRDEQKARRASDDSRAPDECPCADGIASDRCSPRGCAPAARLAANTEAS